MPGTSNSNRPKKYQKITYLQKISTINRNLRGGDICKAARKVGIHAATVSNVVRGKRINDRILNTVYDMTRDRKPTSASV